MNRIKEVLEQKGYSQAWLSEQLGKSYNIVNGYCNNNRQPSLQTLYKIADILQVKPAELLNNKSSEG
ncbi:MAG: XRE family transcriptional regulator [Bacteroidetes bacterium]|nr:MAG: XRE family transcriptional regulator [Bacteroidota bacterium]